MQDEDRNKSIEQKRIHGIGDSKSQSLDVKDNPEGQTDEEGYWHGVCTRKYPNGKTKSQETYVHGVQEGPFTTWYKNGKKESEGAYQNGELHGYHSLWYENGQKREESQYVEGKLNGPQTLWFENGQKHQESHYVDGECKGLRTRWYENGQKAFEALSIKEGVIHGNVNFWHENGQKRVEGGYVYGTPHGPWTEWDDRGHVLCQRRYVVGVQYGRGTRFFTTPLWESMSRRNHLGRQLFWLVVLVIIILAVLNNNQDMGFFFFLAGFWLVILIHELGHFTMARLVGIPIQKFVVGFGPKLAAVLWGHTLYELRMIPMLGYVQPYSFRPSEFDFYNRAKELLRRGEPPADEPAIDGEEEAKAATEYVTRPRRLAFLLGGISFNLLAAFLIAWLALIVAKNPDESNLPINRNPLAAAKLVVDQSMQIIGSIVPSLGPSSRPDSPSPASVVSQSLGIGGFSIFFVSVLLALLNLLPISPLDGSKALQTGIEMTLRRPLPKKILYPIMISGSLLIGLAFVVDLAFMGVVTIGSLVPLDWVADRFHSSALVGPPTEMLILEQNLERYDGTSKTPIEPKTGNQFVVLQFRLEGVKTLIPAQYPIEDSKGNRYLPQGVAFGDSGLFFYDSAYYAKRIVLTLAPEGATEIKRSGQMHPRPTLDSTELLRPEVILLYEVPVDATQFELRHRALRQSFELKKAPAP